MSLDKLGPKSTIEGTKGETPVEDDNAMILLNAILKELQILNLHMEILTDNHFTKEDI